jgi:hypothetical protein
LNTNKTKLLIFCDWYAPAFKAGGPIRSIVNFVDRFKDHYDIYIFTSDRDINEKKRLKNIEADQWLERDGYHIWYYSPGTMSYKKVKSVIAEINPDKIYLNSMFSNMIKPIMAAHASGKLIIAPRGMLRRSALAVKPIRKFIYLRLLQLLGIGNPTLLSQRKKNCPGSESSSSRQQKPRHRRKKTREIAHHICRSIASHQKIGFSVGSTVQEQGRYCT